MPSTLSQPSALTHPNNLEFRRRPAKVNRLAPKDRPVSADAAKAHEVAHKKLAAAEWRVAHARWIDHARVLSRLTADRFAGEVGCSPSQLSTWINNTEPPQLLRVLMSPMRRFVLLAIAEDTASCGVQHQITVTR